MAKAKTGLFQEIIRPTLVLISICVAVAGLLALTYNAAGIAALEAAGLSDKQLEEALPQVLPQGSRLVKAEVSLEAPDLLDVYRDESGAGCAVFVKAKGYGGAMKLLVGFDTDGTVAGVRVMEHGETPGLGTRAMTEEYLSRYRGGAAPFAIKADGGSIDAVTGSTLSSRGIASGVSKAGELYQQVKGDLQ